MCCGSEGAQHGVHGQRLPECCGKLGVQKARCVSVGASMGKGSGGASAVGESSVELKGRLRIVVARAGGGALAIREALTGEEVGRVGPARNVHHPILILREQIEPARLVVTEMPLLVQPQEARVVGMQFKGLVK